MRFRRGVISLPVAPVEPVEPPEVVRQNWPLDLPRYTDPGVCPKCLTGNPSTEYMPPQDWVAGGWRFLRPDYLRRVCMRCGCEWNERCANPTVPEPPKEDDDG
jgi:hypothetical protein